MTTPPRSTERFSNRVTDYIRARPGYPRELFDTLETHVGLSRRSTVADVGSGTGISAEPLLALGCTVLAVEPNREMREAAEAKLSGHPRFRSIEGTAEHTTLADASVDLVTAGQAFHWFDAAETQREFDRILRPRGAVALFWNTRRTKGNAFMEEYLDLLLEFGTDYQRVTHENITPDALERFYGGPYEALVFDNVQVFDFEGLRGRLVSSSYVPGHGHPNFEPMLVRLRVIFDRYQRDGAVHFPYDTELFLGRPRPGLDS
jgi:SAM-dependent methyltransferase